MLSSFVFCVFLRVLTACVFHRVLELEEQIKKEKDQADLLLEQQRVVMLHLCAVFSGLIDRPTDFIGFISVF